jgi:hypothetical protein
VAQAAVANSTTVTDSRSTFHAHHPAETFTRGPPTGRTSSAAPMQAIETIEELCRFDADVLLKRSQGRAGGKAVLVDRQPHTEVTRFAHCLKRHTIALHLEGANTQAEFRYDGGPRTVSSNYA